MSRLLILSILALTTLSCSRLILKTTDEEGSRHITLPFSVLKTALHFSDAGEFEIEDLGGVDEQFDLRAIAAALRQPGAEQMSFSMTSEDSELQARVVGRSLDIESRSKTDDASVTVHLPIAVLDLFAKAGDRPVAANDVLDAIKRQKGVLLDIVDEDGRSQIIIR